MKFIFFIIIALLLPFGSTAQEETVTIPFADASGEKKLKIKIFSGDITITGSDRTDIRVIKMAVTIKNKDSLKYLVATSVWKWAQTKTRLISSRKVG